MKHCDLSTKQRIVTHFGFSLIEMLVVLVIVGVIVGGATVSISAGGEKKALKNSVERLTAYTEHAKNLATLISKPVALLVLPPPWTENPSESGWVYSLQTEIDVPSTASQALGRNRLGNLDEEEDNEIRSPWENIDDLPPVEIPQPIQLRITVEDNEWQWENLSADNPQPIVVFYPTGEVTPFEIEFEHPDLADEPQHLEVNFWGEVRWVEQAELLEEIKDIEESRR